MAKEEQTQVKTVEEFFHQEDEFQTAVRKIVRSHAINELYGSQVFDEPAIALAPTPYAKWLTCRVVYEEYGHHYRFFELGREIRVSGHTRPSARSRAPQNIWPRVMCIS